VQTAAIRERVVSQLVNVDPQLAQAVAQGLGFPVPEAQPRALERVTRSEVKVSKALSLLARPGDGSIRTRRVAILVAGGVAGAALNRLHTELVELGAVARFVGERLGQIAPDDGDAIDIEVTIEAAPAVLWDAVIIPDGAEAVRALIANGQALEFVKDQYRHCKTILAIGAGADLLDAAKIPAELDGQGDPGLLRMDADEADDAAAAFAAALAQHRHFDRQTDPPRV